jgi:hypothetical protein
MRHLIPISAVALLVFFALTRELPTVNVCGLAHHFGLQCPTCGTTHSVWHLLHGRVAAAWGANPIGFFVCFALIRLPLVHVLPRAALTKTLNSAMVDSCLVYCVAIAVAFRAAAIL